jgi:hypothetical protein
MLKHGYEKVNAFLDNSVALPCSKLTLPPRSQTRSRQGLFKIAGLRRWIILVSDPELIEDIKKAPDDILSIRERLREVRLLPARSNLTRTHINPSSFSR